MDWIYWIKFIHTTIFFFASSCIAYIVYCGVVRKTNKYLWASMALVVFIGIVYAINGFECPVATLIYHIAGRRDIADIFFPDWFARKIMPVSTIIYIAGVALVGRNLIYNKKSNSSVNRDVPKASLSGRPLP